MFCVLTAKGVENKGSKGKNMKDLKNSLYYTQTIQITQPSRSIIHAIAHIERSLSVVTTFM